MCNFPKKIDEFCFLIFRQFFGSVSDPVPALIHRVHVCALVLRVRSYPRVPRNRAFLEHVRGSLLQHSVCVHGGIGGLRAWIPSVRGLEGALPRVLLR